MNAFINFLTHNAKAIAGFIAGIIITAVQAVINGQAPWPHSLQDWGKYLGSAIISGVLVWLTGNRLTQQQIVKGAVQQGITVVTDAAISTAANAAQAAVHAATDSLPLGQVNPINEVAQQVSDTVTTVLQGVASNFPSLPKELA